MKNNNEKQNKTKQLIDTMEVPTFTHTSYTQVGSPTFNPVGFEFKQRVLDRLVTMISRQDGIVTEAMVQIATDQENLLWHKERIQYHEMCIAQINARMHTAMVILNGTR